MGQGQRTKVTIFFLALLTLALAQLPLFGQTRRGGTKPAPRPTGPKAQPQSEKVSSVLSSAARGKQMAAAFETGSLPGALPKPAASDDEAAAILARLVSARSHQSTPALLTAITAAGIGVRDSEGNVTQTLRPGQGLVFEAWEIAAMAKMFGESRTVQLSQLSDALKTIPELKQAPLEKILIEGIRKHAQGNQPALRFWARFIVELGRQADEPYDLLTEPEIQNVRLDAIQSALILRRLYGDFYGFAERSKQSTAEFGGTQLNWNSSLSAQQNAFHASNSGGAVPHFQIAALNFIRRSPQTGPCSELGKGVGATISDAAATVITTGWGQLAEYIGATRYAKFMNVANIVLAYAKFIATYAALETEITAENPPLVRTRNAEAGGYVKLTAKVTMNVGKWENLNCIRTALNVATGIDFSLLSDGPMEDVEVNWHLDQGGAGDLYSNRTGVTGQRQIVGFWTGGPRIQSAGTHAGLPRAGSAAVGNATRTRSDKEGLARVSLQGSPRVPYLSPPYLPLMKQAVVRTTIKLKGGDVKGDAVDIGGQALGVILGGAAALLTMPTELLYRVDWASTATLEVPVKDWETCDEGWYGTVTYSEDWEGPTSGFQKVRRKTHTEVIEVKGAVSFADGRVNTTDIYEGRANVANSCLMFRRNFGSGSGRREASVKVLLDENGGYKLFISTPGMAITTRTEISACGHGGKQDQSLTKESNGFGVSVNGVEGRLNPTQPDQISGGADVSESVKVTWNLQRCKR